MRVLHVLSQTELTGSEVYAHHLCLDQVQKKHSLFLVSDQFHLDYSFIKPEHKLNLPISTGSFFQRLKNILILRKFIMNNKIEVIHCHSRAACRHIAWARLFLRVAYVTTLHGYQHNSLSKRLFNIYGDTIICICEKIANQLREQFRIHESKIKVIRNPVQVEAVLPTIESATKIITIAGRASGPKGQKLIALFKQITTSWLDNNPDIQIQLILSGLSSDQHYELSVFSKKHSNQILIFKDKVDLIPLLKKSNLVISSGRIAIEALLCQTPVLALGESNYEGPVDSKNINKCLESNFGDVGFNNTLNTDKVISDLNNFFSKKNDKSSPDSILEIIKKNFDPTLVYEAVEEIYRGNRIAQYIPHLPILMYHKVTDKDIHSKHKTFVNKNNFSKHLQYFRFFRFKTITFQELADWWFEKNELKNIPKKPLLLTFDDGYKDNLKNAMPLLIKNNFRANLFLLSDTTRTHNDWDEKEQDVSSHLLNVYDRQKLSIDAFEIGSHGQTHRSLPSLNSEQVLSELVESRKELEKEFQTNIISLAYPFGHTNQSVSDQAKKAGYTFAVNTDQGYLRWFDNRFSLFRINIFPNENFFSLYKKTSAWYLKRFFKKHNLKANWL